MFTVHCKQNYILIVTFSFKQNIISLLSKRNKRRRKKGATSHVWRDAPPEELGHPAPT
jgi:hypothetical protein